MHDQAFIGRQPIVDGAQQIVAYELLFRHSAEADTAVIEDDVRSCARVLVNTLNDMGTQWLLGDKLAFINVNAEVLCGAFLDLLPPQRTVLELLPGFQHDPTLVERVEALRRQGFRLSLSGVEDPALRALLPHADYVKLDLRKLGLDRALALFARLAGQPVQPVAEKVETKAEFEACKQAGFKLFQGYYFAHPETLSAKVVHPAYAVVLDILNQVRRKAEIKDIEASFKRDVALSFKLLRYINSVGFSLSSEIQSIRHAITILGYDQLYRWLTLLMVTAGGQTTPPALMKTAITRGRLTELLGQDYFEKKERDNLFIVGVFSLLDAILEMPMEQALEKLNLPDQVSEALLTRGGIYGPFLRLAEACEDADTGKIREIAEALVMDPDKVNACHLEALAWAESLGV
jgi:EAL and modified HD-GYP domain-containing signal transduction protein